MKERSIVTIANHKGGVLKTETARYLGAHIKRSTGSTPLMVDLDPQMNLTSRLNAAPDRNRRQSSADLLMGQVSLRAATVIGDACDHLVDVIPADHALAQTAVFLQMDNGIKYRFLRRALRKSDYAYTVIDCAASADVLLLNAIVAATHLIIPVRPEGGALQGAENIIGMINDYRDANRADPDFPIPLPGFVGIVITAYRDGLTAHREERGRIEAFAAFNELPILGTVEQRDGIDRDQRNEESYLPIAAALLESIAAAHTSEVTQ